MGDKKRAFTVVSSSIPTATKPGRYISVEPKQAGHKAGRQIFRQHDKLRQSSKANHIVFIQMVELTRFNKVPHSKERYFYKVTRTKIPEDQRKEQKFKNGSSFTIMYDYKVEEVKQEEFPADHLGGADYYDM